MHTSRLSAASPVQVQVFDPIRGSRNGATYAMSYVIKSEQFFEVETVHEDDTGVV